MAVLRRKPWEKKRHIMSDKLYAVQSLCKDGFILVDGVKLNYGDWQLDVREWEVKRKNLEQSKDCRCITMAEYGGASLESSPEPEVVEELAETVEAELDVAAEELEDEPESESEDEPTEEKPKRKSRRGKKKSEDS
jgi:hypothetical protein